MLIYLKKGSTMVPDIEKDEAATREMLETAGVLTENNEQESTPISAESTDDILGALDDIDNVNLTDDVSTETDDGIDGFLDELDTPDEITLDEAQETATTTETAGDSSEQGEALQNALAGTGLDDALLELDDLSEETLDDLSEETNEPSAEVEETSQTSDGIAQTNDVIDSMEESIDIDNEMQSIAIQASHTAKEATALALNISKQAQDSTEKLQQTIQDTFNATDRAFEALKEAKYEVDSAAIDTDLNDNAIKQKMSEVKSKNDKLKAMNASFLSRINDFKNK